jgi:hypothetical protein
MIFCVFTEHSYVMRKSGQHMSVQVKSYAKKNKLQFCFIFNAVTTSSQQNISLERSRIRRPSDATFDPGICEIPWSRTSWFEIWVALGFVCSNVGQDIRYPDWRIFVVFSPPGKCPYGTSKYVITVSFRILYISLYAFQLVLVRTFRCYKPVNFHLE